MHCRLPHKMFFLLPVCLGLLCIPGASSAQVYKSYDADGNVIFSDQPSDGGSEVEISKPNVSEAFEAPPSSPSSSSPEPEPEPEPEPLPVSEEDIIDTNNDGRISRREIDDYREEKHRKNREAKKAAGAKEDWE